MFSSQFFADRIRGWRCGGSGRRGGGRHRIWRRRVQQLCGTGAITGTLWHVDAARWDLQWRARALPTALGGDDGRIRGGRGRTFAAPTPAQSGLGGQLDGVLVYEQRVVARGTGRGGAAGGEREAPAVHTLQPGGGGAGRARGARGAGSAGRVRGARRHPHDRLRAHRVRGRGGGVPAGDRDAAPRAGLRLPHRHRQPETTAFRNTGTAALQLMGIHIIRPGSTGFFIEKHIKNLSLLLDAADDVQGTANRRSAPSQPVLLYRHIWNLMNIFGLEMSCLEKCLADAPELHL